MFKFEQETAAKFLRDVMRPMDRAAIFTIGEKAVLVQGFDSSEKSVASIDAITPTKQQTAFYDSLRSAVAYVSKNSPEGRRRVFLTISDGEDTNSDGVLKAIWAAERKIADSVQGQALRDIRVKARDSAKTAEQAKVLKALQDADSVFYSINPAGSSFQLNQMSVFGQENMQKFATETGGTAFLPKFLPIDGKDQLQNTSNLRKNSAMLDGIFRQLMNELQAQYLVQYYSDSEFPTGRYVKLKVSLQNSAGRKLRAREGYFVKN
jgi:VWFA-related protein